MLLPAHYSCEKKQATNIWKTKTDQNNERVEVNVCTPTNPKKQIINREKTFTLI